MNIAENIIGDMIRAMSDKEKRIVAETLESEYMRDELIKRHEYRMSINVDFGGKNK